MYNEQNVKKWKEELKREGYTVGEGRYYHEVDFNFNDKNGDSCFAAGVIISKYCCGLKELGYFEGSILLLKDKKCREIIKTMIKVITYHAKNMKRVANKKSSIFCTISEKQPGNKVLLESLREAGWKKTSVFKSNHGNYNIHLFIFQGEAYRK